MMQFLNGVKEQVVALLICLDPKRMGELLQKLDVVLIEVDRHFGNVVPPCLVEHLEMAGTKSGEGLVLEEAVVEEVLECAVGSHAVIYCRHQQESNRGRRVDDGLEVKLRPVFDWTAPAWF
jgi:hypothetical protein